MSHSHYFKDVRHLAEIDVYRVCERFQVDDPSGATQHAIKKILLPGQRGGKGIRQDLQEAVDSLTRRIQMLDEDAGWNEAGIMAASFGQKNMIEPAAGIDDDSPRQQAIGQNGNGGEHYDPEPGWRSGQIQSVQAKEPERPRHVCPTCGQGHSIGQCTAGNELEPLADLAIKAGSKPIGDCERCIGLVIPCDGCCP